MKILFVGPVGDYAVSDGGYGNASSGIVFVLKKMLKNKFIDDLKVISTFDFNGIENLKPIYDVCITVTHPSSFKNKDVKNLFDKTIGNAKRKYLSVVWETVPLPREWNWLWEDTMFDGFLCPSRFIGDQILKLTKKPVLYYPHFINTNLFVVPKSRDLREFKVLLIGQHTKRKNLFDNIIAYVRGLFPCHDASLIIKHHEMSNYELEMDSYIKRIVKTNCDSSKFKAKILTLNEKLSPKKIVKLYQEASIVLCVSRGEGFGLVCVEGMATGIPVIYTNWSSLPEVANSPVNIPISYMLDSSVNMFHYGYEHNSKYAIPNIHETEQALVFMYNEWKVNPALYYEKASVNANIVKERFGYEAIKECLMDIITYGT